MSVQRNTKSNAARIPCGKCGGYMGGKLLLLPGEVLQTASKGKKNLNAAVTTNCKKSAEAIVPVFFFTKEGPNNRKSQVQTGRRLVR